MKNGYSNGNGYDGYYGKSLMSESTRSAIESKFAEVMGHPHYSAALRNKITAYLFNESAINIARLESDLRKISQERIIEERRFVCCSPGSIEEQSRTIRNRVRDAWEFGCKKYRGVVTEELILGLGRIVEPDENKKGTLRDIAVTVGGAFAVDPAKLRSTGEREGDFPRFLRELNGGFVFPGRYDDSEKIPLTPAEKAAYAHFMIYYLQPCFDGNKRVARLVQNLLLRSENLPPPIIYGPENNEYLTKLDSAREARRFREGNQRYGEIISPQEHDFYEYIGKKIFVSLDAIAETLSQHKIYQINIIDPDAQGVRFYTKKRLQRALSAIDRGVQVRIENRKGKSSIVVNGDVEESEIRAAMGAMDVVKSYSIERRH